MNFQFLSIKSFEMVWVMNLFMWSGMMLSMHAVMVKAKLLPFNEEISYSKYSSTLLYHLFCNKDSIYLKTQELAPYSNALC